VYLLDVNVLIALAWDDHVHHALAHAWFGQSSNAGFATCNVTQSGFVRVSLNPKTVNCQLGISEIFAQLESFTKHPNHKFWEDGALQTESPIWQKVTGHNQVTDTNLVLIAHRHGGKLVTLDGAIQNRLQKDGRAWVEVIPK
jgi:toxin-antitoxin system PIN domain toxin